MTAPQQPRQRVETIAARFAALRDSISTGLYATLAPLWIAHNVYDAPEVEDFSRLAAGRIRAAQETISRATEAYLRAVVQTFNVRPPSRIARMDSSALRKADLREAYQRPSETVRYLRSEDKDPSDAYEQGLQRLEAMTDTDVSLAMRETARKAMEPIEVIIGYRRIIRPELSRHGSCGLCAAAADREYDKAELLPLHARCNCIVLPIIEDKPDFGLTLNGEDLAAMYKAAGGTEGAKLKRIRVTINEHGELGPVLSRADHEFLDKQAAEARRN